jgi:hypothetical protein
MKEGRLMTRVLIGAGAAAAMLLLSACATPDPDLGYAIRQNTAAQAVDMQPVYAGLPMEGSNGVRAVDAQGRYLGGRVKDLLKVDGKSNIGGQGGASNESSSSTGRTPTPVPKS